MISDEALEQIVIDWLVDSGGWESEEHAKHAIKTSKSFAQTFATYAALAARVACACKDANPADRAGG